MLVAICVVVAVALSSVSAEVDPGKLIANFGNFTSYIVPPVSSRQRRAGLDRSRRMVLGPGALAAAARRDPADGLCRHRARRDRRLLPLLPAPQPTSRRGRWLRMLVRRFCELCRTVPELVFALMFVIAFGLGPMAGVLAVAIHTLGALGKLFAEVVENIDMKPVEGVVGDRRALDGGDALRRAAADAVELRQLHAAALRGQCPRRHGNGLRRRRRHRHGPRRGDPQVLLLRCLGDPAC